MSQNTQNDYSPSLSSSALKPALAAALASLEVQLDQELTRYRRTRNSGKKHNSVNIQSFTGYNTKTLNKSQFETSPSINLPSIPVVMPSLAVSNNEPEKLDHEEITETEKVMSSIVPSKTVTTEPEDIISIKDTVKQPDDYLESSEALLRSLNDEPTQEPKSQNSSDSVLSPMGIGSMFLLLLASLTLGYVVLNPKYLPRLNFSNLSPNDAASSPENTPIAENYVASTSEPQITPIAKYPNLATQEFTQVRDPNDVVGLKPKVKPTPQITPTSLSIQPPINPVVPLPKLSPVPNISSSPIPGISQIPNASSNPVPKPAISLSPLREDIKPAADGYYYIITDNDSEGSLGEAKKVVADAYLSPNRKFIYLGALKTKDDVKRRLQELADKGIKGRVQEP